MLLLNTAKKRAQKSLYGKNEGSVFELMADFAFEIF